MFLLPITLTESNKRQFSFFKAFGPGKPIHKRTAELMRQLHHARLHALASRKVDLQMDFAREPGHLYFDLTTLIDLLNELRKVGGYNHLAVCPALTLSDNNKPVEPIAGEIDLMEEAIKADNANDHIKFAEIILALESVRQLKLVQTVILAGCTGEGNIVIVDTIADESTSGESAGTAAADSSVLRYYDFAGQCCNKVKGKDKALCIENSYHKVKLEKA